MRSTPTPPAGGRNRRSHWIRWLVVALGPLIIMEAAWLLEQRGRLADARAYAQRMHEASHSSGIRRGLRFMLPDMESDQTIASDLAHGELSWFEGYLQENNITGETADTLRMALLTHIGRLVRLQSLYTLGGFTLLEAQEMLASENIRRRRVVEIIIGEQAASLNALIDEKWARYSTPGSLERPASKEDLP